MTAASAVAASLIPRFVNGLVMHGELGAALRECTTARALRAVVLTLVVPRGGAPAGSLDLIDHFVAALKNTLARLPHEYALGEADFRTCLTSGLLGAASDAVTGCAASHIGELVHPGGFSQGGIPVPVALGLHAANGALGAGIRGEDPLSGAVGAALGEAAGMLYHHVRMRGLQRGTEEYDRALSQGADVARMAAALACIPLNLDADTASRAAGTAAENNAMGLLGPGPLDTYDEAVGQAFIEHITTPLPESVQQACESWDAGVTQVQENATVLDQVYEQSVPLALRTQPLLASTTLALKAAPLIAGAFHAPKTYLELATTVAPVGKGLGASAKLGGKLLQKVAGSLGKGGGTRLPTRVIERAMVSNTGTPLASMEGTTTADLAAARFARAASSGTNGNGTIVGTLTRVESSFHVPGGGPIRTTHATVTPKGAPKTPAASSPASSSGPSTPSQTSSQFWTKTTHFKGNKVYQRDDLINPHLIDRQGRTNLQRMKKGVAPIGPDELSINVHHMLQTQKGALAEVTETFHQMYSDIIHINPSSTPSGIDRILFENWRKSYWRKRAKDFIK